MCKCCRDHQPCCARTGVPPLCQELCSGNVSLKKFMSIFFMAINKNSIFVYFQVTDINFKYFHCLSYMSQLSRRGHLQNSNNHLLKHALFLFHVFCSLWKNLRNIRKFENIYFSWALTLMQYVKSHCSVAFSHWYSH